MYRDFALCWRNEKLCVFALILVSYQLTYNLLSAQMHLRDIIYDLFSAAVSGF